ncbi:MAG: nitronate monooxygenase [SAR324 cluster bacterium]|nr:nitronate monooxygenase [SAR324 cluster bacterium]MCH8885403.1 nitronate monooxygenase [SAR324 cluster bacterium]
MKYSLPPLKIRNLTLKYPLIQGGMGVGISWNRLAGAVAHTGAAGTVSTVGTGYWNTGNVRLINGRPLKPVNFQSSKNLTLIIKDAIKRSKGNGSVGVNILCAVTDYERQVKDSIKAGAQYIISGAGLPLRLPEYAENADVALIPIVSSPRVVDLICKRWKRSGRIPDAIVLEGPKSGGHQGYTYEQCFQQEYQLEVMTPPVLKSCKAWGNIPLIVAGGIWDYKDIEMYMDMGVAGVQIATRFIGTEECDASPIFKQVILNSKQKDIKLLKSPVGYPARAIATTPLIQRVVAGFRPKIPCISNCVTPCDHGKESNKVGYCIADSLGDAWNGVVESGLFFTGSNGYRINKLQTVEELIEKLMGIREDTDTWEEDPESDEMVVGLRENNMAAVASASS